MTSAPDTNKPQSLFELSWAHAQDAKVAVDAATVTVLDVNRAAVALTGYSRKELIGMHVTMLHPAGERAQVEVAFRKTILQPAPHFDLHIQRKDGHCVPVAIWSSEKLQLDGQGVVIGEFRDITDQVHREHQLSAQNWALGAYAVATLALGGKHSSEELLFEAICKAITLESIYQFAWVGIAEDGPGKRIRIAAAVANAAAGNMAKFLDGLHLNWSEDDPAGKSPAGTCIRTNEMQIVPDTEKSAAYAPWLKHLKQSGIRSSVFVPFSVMGRVRGALGVYAAHPNTFEAAAIEVFQHLAEQIGQGVHAIEQEQRLLSEREQLAEAELRLTETLSAMVAPIVLAMEMRDPYTAGSPKPGGGDRCRHWQGDGLAGGSDSGIAGGGAGSRYRKDLNTRRNPDQAGPSQCGREGHDQPTLRDRLHHSERHSVCVADCGDRAPASREAGWLRLSQGPEGG
jgi:PAS domain S-box-containing protein